MHLASWMSRTAAPGCWQKSTVDISTSSSRSMRSVVSWCLLYRSFWWQCSAHEYNLTSSADACICSKQSSTETSTDPGITWIIGSILELHHAQGLSIAHCWIFTLFSQFDTFNDSSCYTHGGGNALLLFLAVVEMGMRFVKKTKQRIVLSHWFSPVFHCFPLSAACNIVVLLGSSFMQTVDSTSQVCADFLHYLYLSFACARMKGSAGQKGVRMKAGKGGWEQDYSDTAPFFLSKHKTCLLMQNRLTIWTYSVPARSEFTDRFTRHWVTSLCNLRIDNKSEDTNYNGRMF